MSRTNTDDAVNAHEPLWHSPRRINRRTALALAGTATIGGCHFLGTKRCEIAFYSPTGQEFTAHLELPESLHIDLHGGAITLQHDRCRLELAENQKLRIRGMTVYSREEINCPITVPPCPTSHQNPTLILSVDERFTCTAEWANEFPLDKREQYAKKFHLWESLIPYIWLGPEQYEEVVFGLRQRPIPFASRAGITARGTPEGQRKHQHFDFLLSPKVSPEMVFNAGFDTAFNDYVHFRVQTDLTEQWINRPDTHNAFWFESTADGTLNIATFHSPTMKVQSLKKAYQDGIAERPESFVTVQTEKTDMYIAQFFKKPSPAAMIDLRFDDEM